jgi:hypothetical protein
VEEILIALLQVILEVLGNVLLEIPWDFTVSSGERRASVGEKEPNNARWFLGSVVLGATFAGISLLFARHAFIARSEFRVANLILAPIVSSIVAYRISKVSAAKSRPWNQPDRHAMCAFLFTGTFATIRFLCAAR